MKTDYTTQTLSTVDFPGKFSSQTVAPYIAPDCEVHYEALKSGKLLLPHCAQCHRTGPPSGGCCPWCGNDERSWQPAQSAPVIHSWVRYHRAYLPEFNGLVPYEVIAARFGDGPVLFGRWLANDVTPVIGTEIRPVIERWADGFCGVAFSEKDANL